MISFRYEFLLCHHFLDIFRYEEKYERNIHGFRNIYICAFCFKFKIQEKVEQQQETINNLVTLNLLTISVSIHMRLFNSM